MKSQDHYSRRHFISAATYAAGSAMLCSLLPWDAFAGSRSPDRKVRLSGHLWVYASKYPPDWDCTPILDTVFSDFKYAGLAGVEVMESILRHKDATGRFDELIHKYDLPLTGTSYNADMWDKNKAQEIIEDVSVIVERLHKLGGSTFGISVGDAGRRKTEQELDTQAALLIEILKTCARNKIEANLHNHTYEVKDGLHDLKCTLSRIPDVKLGPDLNWLVRAGVDPVWFINRYGPQMVYLHIRDQYADGKWTETVGQGVTDFPAIAKALEKVNFKGNAAIELAFDSAPRNSIKEDWKVSRQYVAKVFGW